MEIKLAETAGFCMGVRRAVDKALEVAQREKGRPIFTYGPLIHNPQTIEILKNRGITAVSQMADIPDKNKAVLIIRAHGIAPDERKKIRESGVQIIDATCPKVAHVQAIIKKHAARNYTVIIVGDRQHPEVDGLWGYTKEKGIVVSTPDEAAKLPPLENVCIVAQTTQDTQEYKLIVDKIKQNSPHAIVFNTICSSTERRQEEIIALAQEMDALFVVGGKNSANTCRLADLSRKQNTPTFHIEAAQEIKPSEVTPYKNIGVSAGASTPNWIIDQVVDHLLETKSSPSSRAGFLLKLWLWMVKTEIYAALGAAALAFAGMLLQNLPVNITSLAVAALFVFAMHVINRLASVRESGLIGSFRENSYRNYEKIYRRAAGVALSLALLLSLANGWPSFLFMFVISLAGGLYNMKILSGRWRFQRLKDIPGSKNFFTAVAWGMVTAVLPSLQSGRLEGASVTAAFFFAFALVFTRSAMSDILDMQSDKLLGRETIPVLIGKEKTQRLLRFILLILLIILITAALAGWTSSLGYYLILCPLYVWICFRLCDRKTALSGATVAGLLETSYIIAGFTAVIRQFFL